MKSLILTRAFRRLLVFVTAFAGVHLAHAQFTVTSLTSTPGTSASSPYNIVVGTSLGSGGLSFTISFNQLGASINTIEVRNAPTGLALANGTSANGVLSVTNTSTATFVGTPTAQGLFTASVNAITSTGLNSISQVSPWEIFFRITDASGTNPPIPPAPPAQPAQPGNAPGPQAQRFSVVSEGSFLTGILQQQALENRLAANDRKVAQQGGGGDGTAGNGLYAEVTHRKIDFDRFGLVQEASSSATTMLVGGDWHVSPAFLVGAMLNYDLVEIELDSTGSNIEQTSLAPAIYAQVDLGGWQLLASVAMSDDDYEMRRSIIQSGVGRTAAASTSGNRTDFNLMLSRPYTDGNWIITPKIGIFSSKWDMDGFTEVGTISPLLTFDDRSVSSLRGKIGADAVLTGPRFNHRFGAAWLHEFDDERTLSARLAGSATGFTVAGRPAGSYLATVHYGIDTKLSNGMVAYAGLAGAWSDVARVTAEFTAGVRWNF